MSALFCLFLCFRSYPEKLEVYIPTFYKIRYILEELHVAVMWIISRLIIYIDQLNTANTTQQKLHCDIITFAVIVWHKSHVTKVFSWRHSCFRLTSLVIVVTRCHYYFFNFFFSSFWPLLSFFVTLAIVME